MLIVYTRWDIEDFDVVAFAYTPIPSSLKSVVLGGNNAGISSGNLLNKTEVNTENDCLYIIDPSTYDDLEAIENREKDTNNNTNNNSNINNNIEKRGKNSIRRSQSSKGVEASIWSQMTQQVLLSLLLLLPLLLLLLLLLINIIIIIINNDRYS